VTLLLGNNQNRRLLFTGSGLVGAEDWGGNRVTAHGDRATFRVLECAGIVIMAAWHCK
jgi:hypothetical protein